MKSLADNFDSSMCVATRLGKLNRVFAKYYTRSFKELGLTPTQASILFLVHDHGPLQQSELGKRHHLERSTVTRDLVRLVERGYIEKASYPVSPMLGMTEEGKTFLMEKVAPAWKQAQTAALDHLGMEGEEALNRLTLEILTE